MQASVRPALCALATAAVLAGPLPAFAHHVHHAHSSGGAHHHHAKPVHSRASQDSSVSQSSILPAKLTPQQQAWLSPGDPVYSFVRKHVPAARLTRPYTFLIHKMAAKHGVPPLLVAGIIEYESHYDTHCTTGRARGLMQVNHGHERPGQDLWDPTTNIDIGCRVLRDYHDWAAHHMPSSASSWDVWHKALTAYNYGPIQVVSRGLIRSRYSRKVIGTWRDNLPDR